jgi:hypothetical protein
MQEDVIASQLEPPQRSLWFRIIAFTLVLAAIAWTWLIVLPWVARWPTVEAHLDHLNSKRINAAAMFYTELESP